MSVFSFLRLRSETKSYYVFIYSPMVCLTLLLASSWLERAACALCTCRSSSYTTVLALLCGSAWRIILSGVCMLKFDCSSSSRSDCDEESDEFNDALFLVLLQLELNAATRVFKLFAAFLSSLGSSVLRRFREASAFLPGALSVMRGFRLESFRRCDSDYSTSSVILPPLIASD